MISLSLRAISAVVLFGFSFLHPAGAAEPDPSGSPVASPAYPTAGGADGTVITVTNLADSGPGTLREALDAEGPRIIRFATGGEIWLKDTLPIKKPFVTVEGESAPAPGITLLGDRLRIRTHDVILRHVRVRVGALLTASDPQNRDGIQIDGAQDGSDPGYNILVENCSVSWAIDENIQIWGKNNHDIVVRNCILAEGLNKSIHPKGGTHSAGLVVGPGIDHLVIQGNLFASNAFRNPVLSAGSSAVVVNNLIYNPGFSGIHVYGRPGDVKLLADLIGNVVIAGPNTRPELGFFHEKGLNAGSQIFLEDNAAIGTKSFDLDSRPAGWAQAGTSPFVGTPPVPLPDWLSPIPSGRVEATVLAQAGARPNQRDPVDARIVEEVKTRTGSMKDFPTDARLCPQKPAAPDAAMGEYARLLKRYVTLRGVRYAEWKANSEDMAALRRVVNGIASASEGDLAFYLNAHNAWMLHEVLKEYPIQTVQDSGLGFFDGSRIKVAGKETSFRALEKEIATRFPDQRVAFALYLASKSGPDLAAEPFASEQIKAQLDRQAGLFINSEKGVFLNGEVAAVSDVFEWHKSEFPNGTAAVIKTYRHKSLPENVRFVFQEYDWSLNETAVSGGTKTPSVSRPRDSSQGAGESD